MDGYDLECIAKDTAWCVSFGFIPVVGVCDLLSLVFPNTLIFYLPLLILGLFSEVGFPNIGELFDRFIPEGLPAEVRLLPLVALSD